MNLNIAGLNGDSSGPELMAEALKVLNATADIFGHDVNLQMGDFGAQAILDHGSAFPEDTKKLVMEADAILKAPVGLDSKGMKKLQEMGYKMEQETVLELRNMLDTYGNLRPMSLSKK